MRDGPKTVARAAGAPGKASGRHSASRAGVGALLGVTLILGFAGCGTPPRRPLPTTGTVAPLLRPPANLEAVPDAVPRVEPLARLGNPPFYDVMGRRYVLLASADGYIERGVASWYGPDFHGIATSTGEPYDMYAMTAAHKTLPLPCYLRVTNLRNGRSIVVRVNDRGPFVGNRLVDLSYTAALKLDMVRDGTALVEVRSVSAEAPAAPQGAAPLYVQAGAFAEELNAMRLADRLRAAGFANVVIGSKARAGRVLFRVHLGPVASVEEFDLVVAHLATLGIADARLALD